MTPTPCEACIHENQQKINDARHILKIQTPKQLNCNFLCDTPCFDHTIIIDKFVHLCEEHYYDNMKYLKPTQK